MVRQMSVHEICALSFRTFHSEKYADDYNKGQGKVMVSPQHGHLEDHIRRNVKYSRASG